MKVRTQHIMNVIIICYVQTYQREQMKKLWDHLAARQSSGEQNLTIKFVKGIPGIVNTDKIVNNSQNF